MVNLIDELFQFDAESDWTSDDFLDPHSGLTVLTRYLQHILDLLCYYHNNITHAYIAVTGIEAGVYTPVVAKKRELKAISCCHTLKQNTMISMILSSHPNEQVILIRDPRTYENFVGDLKIKEKLIITLNGYGELYGFISLDSEHENVFNNEIVNSIKAIQPVLSRIIADAVFSMRLRTLVAPFESAARKEDLLDLYKEITDRALLAFAAAGAIIRIYDPYYDRLEAKASSGEVDNANTLLAPDSIGENICKLVLRDPNHSWTVGMLEEHNDPKFSGAIISKDMEDQLKRIGIRSYFVMELVSEVIDPSKRRPIGTLAFFHYKSHRFSWRDISLAKSLCQRAADIITLYNNTLELEDANEHLYLESKLITKAEVTTLLAHDLGHKALTSQEYLDELIRQTKKAIRDSRPFNSIKEYADDAVLAAENLTVTLHNINKLFPTDDSAQPNNNFKILEIVTDILKLMDDALHRNDFNNSDINIPPELQLNGNKNLFSHALYNLVINSVQAQKYRPKKSQRTNRIHIHARLEKQGMSESIVILYWDEGPGINTQVFRNPHDIFELGTSTKGGTGRGLPISRNLISTFFGGNLWLEDSRKALFKITIPIRGSHNE